MVSTSYQGSQPSAGPDREGANGSVLGTVAAILVRCCCDGRGMRTISHPRTWICLVVLSCVVLTGCAQGESGSPAPKTSGPVDPQSPTTTQSPPPSGESDCSAATSSAALESQAGLPDPVAEMRQAIAEAAV